MSAVELEKNWLAIYTNSRAEKKVEERLIKEGIEAYCPTYTTVKQWSDRKKKVILPLIPSYVFVKVDIKERQKVLMSQGVLNYVYWQGKPAIIRDKEISILQNQLTNRVIPEGKVGDFIQIKDGVFKGLEGTIKEIQTSKTIITLESLGITIHLSSL